MTGQIPNTPDQQGGAFVTPPYAGPQPVPPVCGSPSTTAIIAFVLGILSFVVCGPCAGIPALIIGLIELRNIRAMTAPPEGRAFAMAGAIMGGINAALMVILLLVYAFFIIFALLVQSGAD
jgi:hypothetical protein